MAKKILKKLNLGWKRFTLAFMLLALIILFSYLKRHGLIIPDKIFEVLANYPRLAPILFVSTYTILSVVLVPTLPLNIGAGFLWGPLWGTFLSILGATSGAICAFLIARYLGGDYFNQQFRHSAWIWLRNEIDKNAWKSVAFTRINPIFSFGPLNYFFGITSIPFSTYTWATIVFLLPPSALFASVGHSIGDFTLNGAAYGLLRNTLIVSAIFTALVFIRLVIKRRFSSPLNK